MSSHNYFRAARYASYSRSGGADVDQGAVVRYIAERYPDADTLTAGT